MTFLYPSATITIEIILCEVNEMEQIYTIVALVMGLDSILSFSIPMMAGIAMGTFNSICFVPSLWVWWQTKRGITVLKPAKKKAKTSV